MIYLTEEERLKALEACDKILAAIRSQREALANIAKIADNLAAGKPAAEGLEVCKHPVDTSDIPEAGEDWFKRAEVREPHDAHVRERERHLDWCVDQKLLGNGISVVAECGTRLGWENDQ